MKVTEVSSEQLITDGKNNNASDNFAYSAKDTRKRKSPEGKTKED